MSKICKSLMLFPLLFLGCTAPSAAITSVDSPQLEIRQLQTRDYEGVTQKQAMRAAIAAFQDLDFILEKVDSDLGTVTASKYASGCLSQVTMTARESGIDSVTIRFNIVYGQKVVTNPAIYQDLFSTFDKSVFLVKNKLG